MKAGGGWLLLACLTPEEKSLPLIFADTHRSKNHWTANQRENTPIKLKIARIPSTHSRLAILKLLNYQIIQLPKWFLIRVPSSNSRLSSALRSSAQICG
jgi:hypothetical protein